jgi:predicted GNAT family N-acyltransferase
MSIHSEAYRVLLADTKELKQKAFEIREEVFVHEQKVDPEEEFDEFEDISRHFVVLDEQGQGIGASRWRKTDKGFKLERFAVKTSERGKGIGQAIVKATLADIEEQVGTGNYLYMHAQLDAVSLYERFGFKKKGEQFEECDILHYLMEKVN